MWASLGSIIGGSSSMIFTGGGMSVSCQTMSPMQVPAGGTVTVNGQRVAGPCTVEVRGGKVLIDGKTPDSANVPAVTVTIEITSSAERPYSGPIRLDCGTVRITGSTTGPVQTTAADVTIEGNAASVSSTSGDVRVTGDVSGSAASTSGDVTVGGDVKGSATSVSGDVRVNGRKTSVARHRSRVAPSTPLTLVIEDREDDA